MIWAEKPRRNVHQKYVGRGGGERDLAMGRHALGRRKCGCMRGEDNDTERLASFGLD